jgi:hypothetical protein
VRDDYLGAVLEPDPFRARAIVRGAADEGIAVATLYAEVLAPVLVEVGEVSPIAQGCVPRDTAEP